MANEADESDVSVTVETLTQQAVASAGQQDQTTPPTNAPEAKTQEEVPEDTMSSERTETVKATNHNEEASTEQDGPNAAQAVHQEANEQEETPSETMGSDNAINGANGGETSAQNNIAAEEISQDKIESKVEFSQDPKESTSNRKGAYVERDWRERREDDNRRDNPNSRGGRGGRGGHGGSFQPNERKPPKNYSENVKSDLTSLPESSDHDEIRKQVEFYFSDSNLPGDAFLLLKVGGSKNDPVEISIVHSFKRMRHFQPYSAVVEALRASDILDVVDDDKIHRKIPLPTEVIVDNARANVELIDDKTRSRSIYAKGFGRENASTQFDIEAFFAPYGPTNAIRLRRKDNKLFKGSVFVEFDCDETAQAFLELESKPKWEGKVLQIMSKEKYVRGKAEDVAAGRIKPNTWSSRGGRGRGRGNRDRDNRDGRDRRDNDPRNGHRPNRGRGSRGGWRGGDRNRSRDRDRDGRRDSNGDGKEKESPKEQVDDRYIPLLHITSPPQFATNTALSGIPAVESTQAGAAEAISNTPVATSTTTQVQSSPVAPTPMAESKKRNVPADEAENGPGGAKKAKTELDVQSTES